MEPRDAEVLAFLLLRRDGAAKVPELREHLKLPRSTFYDIAARLKRLGFVRVRRGVAVVDREAVRRELRERMRKLNELIKKLGTKTNGGEFDPSATLSANLRISTTSLARRFFASGSFSRSHRPTPRFRALFRVLPRFFARSFTYTRIVEGGGANRGR